MAEDSSEQESWKITSPYRVQYKNYVTIKIILKNLDTLGNEIVLDSTAVPPIAISLFLISGSKFSNFAVLISKWPKLKKKMTLIVYSMIGV